MSEALDPRWAALSGRKWRCGCGNVHTGLFDLGCDRPDFWPVENGESPNSEALISSHFASEDFCVIDGESFFVRCVLQIPLIGLSSQVFGYGVWSTLSRSNYELYRDGFDGGAFDDGTVWTGWLSNRLSGYPDTVSLKVFVIPQSGHQRPLIELMDQDHPLVGEQREGITYDRLVEIYGFYGHAPFLSEKSSFWDFALGKQ